MPDITVTVPDDVWPRVAAAFHTCYPNNVDTPDMDLVQLAAKSYIRDIWVSTEQATNSNAGAPRYNQAAEDYNVARQAVDADIQAQNNQVLADSQAAFPGI
jgi:hypothetical protein